MIYIKIIFIYLSIYLFIYLSIYLFIYLLECLDFSVLFYFTHYISTNIYIKSICRIVYKNENKYKRLLEPFLFHYISMLPSAYWREILNIKFNIRFKKLYMQKNFYHQINKDQLICFLKNHPVFFTLHYLVIISGVLGVILIFFSYINAKYV